MTTKTRTQSISTRRHVLIAAAFALLAALMVEIIKPAADAQFRVTLTYERGNKAHGTAPEAQTQPAQTGR